MRKIAIPHPLFLGFETISQEQQRNSQSAALREPNKVVNLVRFHAEQTPLRRANDHSFAPVRAARRSPATFGGPYPPSAPEGSSRGHRESQSPRCRKRRVSRGPPSVSHLCAACLFRKESHPQRGYLEYYASLQRGQVKMWIVCG